MTDEEQLSDALASRMFDQLADVARAWCNEGIEPGVIAARLLNYALAVGSECGVEELRAIRAVRKFYETYENASARKVN